VTRGSPTQTRIPAILHSYQERLRGLTEHVESRDAWVPPFATWTFAMLLDILGCT